MQPFKYPFNVCTVFLWVLLLSGCGGGGGGSEPTSSPTPPAPEPDPVQLTVIDATPGAMTTTADPESRHLRIVHEGYSNLDLTFDGNCTSPVVRTVRRSLPVLSASSIDDADELTDHRIRCNRAASTQHTLSASGTRSGTPYELAHTFSTGPAGATGLVIQDSIDIPGDTINNLFDAYAEGALGGDLNVTETLLLGLVSELAEANWESLTNPEALYDVRSERVSYRSQQPDGSIDGSLTGLVARPLFETVGGFIPRNQVLVLTHATGSTPSELNFADAWFLLANLFASRGYLVVAADNYGRGGTILASETYLMNYQTAVNTLDLLEQVLQESRFESLDVGGHVSIIGYSQGGHSAIGLWELMETQGPTDLTVASVFAGGGPHNLYATVEGVLQHLDGSCQGGPYCTLVDEEVLVPFATDRILPGLLDYTDTGLALSDVVIDGSLSPALITGFLQNNAEVDPLKLQLQLNSFAAVTSAATSYATSSAQIHLYHSEFDRLVPYANTDELFEVLSPHVDVQFHRGECNADGYELLFNLTSQVGVIHTLCGISVLDEVFEALK